MAPYDLKGTVHDCKSTGTKKVETRPLTLEQMDIRLKRVEATLFKSGSISQIAKKPAD